MRGMALRPELLLPHLLCVALGLLLAVLAWKKPVWARVSFVALFGLAAVFNLRTALVDPSAYLSFATLTDSTHYRALILGPFARHVTAWVCAIALGQALIALGLLLRGRLAQVAAIGAIVFLCAIAPLGVGSAMPSSLLMAGGMVVLLLRRFPTTLGEDLAPHPPVDRHHRA